MAAIKKQYVLDGLCCANCAAKIEKEVAGLADVSGANVDFASRTLTVELAREEAVETVAERASGIAKSHDPDIVMKEKAASVSDRKTLYLSGMEEDGWAERLQEKISRLEGIRSAKVDPAAKKLTVTAVEREHLPDLARRASQTVRQMFPGAAVSYTAPDTDAEASDERRQTIRRVSLAAGAILFVLGMVLRLPPAVDLAVFLAAYVLVGGEIVLQALKNIAKGEVFDENFLMSVASIGAFAIGQGAEGVAVMLFYRIGEFFQDLAVDRSRASISALMDIRPDYANLKTENGTEKVSPEEIGIGEQILVRPGEKIPLDGTVVEGKSSVDTSALTGESLPRDVEPGAAVLSGSVNKSGLLTIEVTREFGESTVSKILDLVQNAGGRKAPTEQFITKFARYYTPAVVFSAAALALLPPLLVPGASFADWLGRALTFLVVSCPCALVISIPLGFFGGIGGASKKGVLIKGSGYLEALNNVDTVVFDKTGTLTRGNFKVTQIVPQKGWTQEHLLDFAAHAEMHSTHPIAVSICEALGHAPDEARVTDYEELSGKGVRAKVDGREVLAGNAKLLTEAHTQGTIAQNAGTVVHLAVDGEYAGYLTIADEIKTDSEKAIRSLKAAGVRKTVMLTGDKRETAEAVARQLGIDTVYAELLPQQKVERVEELEKTVSTGGKVVFVGDGINDAPVLARADVGVAMGGLGSDAAIEAADVVLMTDEPSHLETAVRIARHTRSIVRQNIVFALGVKFAILILAAFGLANMWEAVFGDVGVALIAVLNSTRAAHVKK